MLYQSYLVVFRMSAGLSRSVSLSVTIINGGGIQTVLTLTLVNGTFILCKSAIIFNFLMVRYKYRIHASFSNRY